MRNFSNLPVQFFNPVDFVPYTARVPKSVAVSRDYRTYPSGSKVNPGYAYGTFIPLTDFTVGMGRFLKPYTIPVGPTGLNTIPAKWNNKDQWGDPTAALRLKGTTTDVPVIDLNESKAIQQYLANAKL